MSTTMLQKTSALLAIATTAGGRALALRRPLIVAFIAMGILVAPVHWFVCQRPARS